MDDGNPVTTSDFHAAASQKPHLPVRLFFLGHKATKSPQRI
jgi:hypothetical protein